MKRNNATKFLLVLKDKTRALNRNGEVTKIAFLYLTGVNCRYTYVSTSLYLRFWHVSMHIRFIEMAIGDLSGQNQPTMLYGPAR